MAHDRRNALAAFRFHIFVDEKPRKLSDSMISEGSSFKKCDIELGGVFLPSYFDEYDKSEFSKSKINILLRSLINYLIQHIQSFFLIEGDTEHSQYNRRLQKLKLSLIINFLKTKHFNLQFIINFYTFFLISIIEILLC